jgi:hypothetical protein
MEEEEVVVAAHRQCMLWLQQAQAHGRQAAAAAVDGFPTMDSVIMLMTSHGRQTPPLPPPPPPPAEGKSEPVR